MRVPVRPLDELVHPSWVPALEPVAGTIAQLGSFLRAEVAAGRGYLPAGHHVLRAFTLPLPDVRVLVVGQDPYPTTGHPVGLSFSVAPDVRPVPRSLQNIYQELGTDLGLATPANGGHLLRLTVQGDLRDILHVAASHDATNLVAHEPSLEEIFLRFYTADGRQPAPAGREVPQLG